MLLFLSDELRIQYLQLEALKMNLQFHTSAVFVRTYLLITICYYIYKKDKWPKLMKNGQPWFSVDFDLTQFRAAFRVTVKWPIPFRSKHSLSAQVYKCSCFRPSQQSIVFY